MLSVAVVLAGFAVYAIAYWGYAKWFDRNIIESDPKKVTPSHMYMDGIEFFPSNKYVLLGFQWKSIAAMGPVIGPIVAMKWGWLPGLLYVLFGNLFIGWLHDYVAVMVSVKSEGASFGPLTYDLIGKRSRTLLLAFIAFYLLLSLSSYGMTVALAWLGKFPQAPMPLLITCIVSVIAGILTFKYKVPIVHTTILSLVLITIGAGMGFVFPVTLPEWIVKDVLLHADFWYFWVLLFCYLGAVLPVWLFIQPVNYLSFYLVYATIVAVLLGIFIGHPSLHLPVYTTFAPIAMHVDPLWPIMFAVIMCGAISGWHSIVGTAVTSKQLSNERDGVFVGAGAMLMEGILALATIAAVAALLPAEVKDVPAPALAVIGWAKSLGYLGITIEVATGLVALVLSVLAITVLHINLRVMRLCLTELFGERIPILKNMYIAALIPCILAWLLGAPRFGGMLIYVWVLFGGANQLLAGMMLLLATLWLVRLKKPAYFTGIPMAFLIITTLSAIAIMINVTREAAMKAVGLAAIGNWLAMSIAILLLVLGIVFVHDAIKAYRKWKVTPSK